MEELDVTAYAVSVDTKELAQGVVENNKLTFHMAYAATKADGDLLGSWWSEERGGYIQPTEFLLGRGGTVLGAMYATGPVGRMGANEAIHYITYRESIRRKDEE